MFARSHDKGKRRGGAMAEGYTIKHIDEFEEMEGSGGATWRLARKTLGAEAFGFNVVDIEAGGEIPAHDHTGDNQEEVFIILEGEGDDRHRRRGARRAGRDLLPLRPGGEPHDPQRLGRERPRAADRRPGRQRLPGDALGLEGRFECVVRPAPQLRASGSRSRAPADRRRSIGSRSRGPDPQPRAVLAGSSKSEVKNCSNFLRFFGGEILWKNWASRSTSSLRARSQTPIRLTSSVAGGTTAI